MSTASVLLILGLIVSLSYGIGGPILTVALLSLALNISLTGLFILWVKRLLTADETRHVG